MKNICLTLHLITDVVEFVAVSFINDVIFKCVHYFVLICDILFISVSFLRKYYLKFLQNIP